MSYMDLRAMFQSLDKMDRPSSTLSAQGLIDVLVAVATYRAETIRSHRQTREIDISAAARKFERNPFAWTEADAQLWSLLLVARWSWQTRGSEREAFITVRLHNLRQQGLPGPLDIGDRDYRLWRDLEQVAVTGATQMGGLAPLALNIHLT